MKQITKKYKKEDVFIVWKPDVCIHSAVCFKGLKGVFDPQKKPWVNVDGATKEEIIKQVSKCPSGALSYIKE